MVASALCEESGCRWVGGVGMVWLCSGCRRRERCRNCLVWVSWLVDSLLVRSGEQRKGCGRLSGCGRKKDVLHHVMKEVVAGGRLEGWHCGIVGDTGVGCSIVAAADPGLEGEPIVGQKRQAGVDMLAVVHTGPEQVERAG